VTTIREVEDFLALHRIAMVGVSRNPEDFSRKLFREMCERGYDMVPVNLVAEEIDGRECLENGIRVVDGHCPFMFFRGTKFPHRVHGFLQKITGRYPAVSSGARSPTA
jgi:hypothetical protein